MEPGVSYSTSPKPVEPMVLAPKLVRPIIAIVVVIVLVLLGIYVYKYVKKPSPTVESQVPATSIATTPIAQNSDWKDYVDPSNIFSIKYPPEYTLSNYSESAFSGIQLSFFKPATSDSASAQITVKIIYLQHSAKTAKLFALDQAALEKSSTLNDLTISLKGEWGRGKIIFMEKDGTVYRFSSVIAAPLNFIPGYEDTVNKIFASFTILNPDDRGK